MKIILAPDSFKESLSAKEVCKAMKTGILNVFPSANIVEFPMADGGEGTIDTLVYATKGKHVIVDIKDPFLRDIKGNYGILGDNETCVIEIAQAVGLNLVNKFERNPLKTTSYGIGELIKHALNDGYKKFIVGLGGSSTNDGGAGMLQALGIKLLTDSKQEIQPGGKNLQYIHSIDISGFDNRIKHCEFLIASDVTK